MSQDQYLKKLLHHTFEKENIIPQAVRSKNPTLLPVDTKKKEQQKDFRLQKKKSNLGRFLPPVPATPEILHHLIRQREIKLLFPFS